MEEPDSRTVTRPTRGLRGSELGGASLAQRDEPRRVSIKGRRSQGMYARTRRRRDPRSLREMAAARMAAFNPMVDRR